MKLFKFFASPAYLNQRVSPIGLGLFRIVYSMVLLWEVWQLYYFRHLIFDAVPFQEAGDLDFYGASIFWMMSLVALLVGWQTRVVAGINFGFSLLTFAVFGQYEYHFDHVAHAVNFLLVFMPVSEALSIDAFLKRREHEPQTSRIEENGVHPIYYQVLMFFGIGLLYFDSVTWKIGQTAWQQGLGIWRPMSVPPFTWFPTVWLQSLLNQKWIMILGNHATLFLEVAFIFLMWSRRCRIWILMPLGIVLHFGILLAFPIPKFSFVMLALYIVVLPPDIWENFFSRIAARFQKTKSKANRCDARFNETVSIKKFCNRAICVHLVVALMVTGTLLQSLLIADGQFGHHHKIVGSSLKKFMHSSLGICPHGVFLDYHWTNYDHVVAVVQVNPDGSYKWLPLTTPSGQMGSYATDRFWAKWAFRANGPTINNQKLEKAIKCFTAFWIKNQRLDDEDIKFYILTKTFQPFEGWSKDLLTNQMNMPWQISGVINWNNQKCSIALSNIEDTQLLESSKDPFRPATLYLTNSDSKNIK